MKKVIKIIVVAVFILSIFAMNVSAIYELQNEYDYCAHSWYKNGNCIGNFNIEYNTGGIMWYDDAEVFTEIQAPFDIATSQISGYVWAEVRNEYDNNYDDDYQETFDSVTRLLTAYASIDDVYATYTHHNNDYYYKGVKQAACPITYGERA